jgi:hypothetical protein
MKFIRIAGLCLVAMFAMSMVAAGTASAVPVWEHCETEKGGTATKYESDQCKTALSGGEFSWQEVKGTEAVRSHGSLLLTDTKVPIEGEVSVSCTGENVGFVGPKNHDRITEIINIHCVPDKGCEKVEGETATPLGLPWQTEIVETEGGRDDIKAVEAGKEAGWSVECKVLGVTKADECKTNAGSTSLENVWTKGVGKGELLVLTQFDEHTAAANCSVGGTGAGKVRGPVAILQASGQALRIS